MAVVGGANERSPEDASPASGTRAAQAAIWAAIALAAMVLVVLGWAVLRQGVVTTAGQEAPDFELETFDGPTLRLSDFRGQVVVLNFWASWCRPCEEEAAELESIWRDYRSRGVTVLGIDYMDTRASALAYLNRYDITYPNGPDRGDRISRAYGLSGVPETLVIDRDGSIVGLPVGDSAGRTDRLVGPIAEGSSLGPERFRILLDELTREPPGDG